MRFFGICTSLLAILVAGCSAEGVGGEPNVSDDGTHSGALALGDQGPEVVAAHAYFARYGDLRERCAASRAPELDPDHRRGTERRQRLRRGARGCRPRVPGQGRPARHRRRSTRPLAS